MADIENLDPDLAPANAELMKLPARLTAAIDRPVAPESLCGPDAELDELVDEAVRTCDDLEDRLFFEMRERARLAFLASRDGSDPLNHYRALVRVSYAASRVFAGYKDEEGDTYCASAHRFRAINLREVAKLCDDSSIAVSLFESSVDVSEESVRSFPKDGPSDEWVKVQQNLAEAMFQLSLCVDSAEEERDLLERTTQACEEARRHGTNDDVPRERYELQQMFSSALLKLSRNADLANAREMRARASAALEDALEILDRDANPEEWSQTQEFLGGMRAYQAELEDGGKVGKLLAAAAKAFKAALRATSREAQPVLWARIQANLASVSCGRAAGSAKDFAQKHYGRAVEAYERALEVFNLEDHPESFVNLSRNLGEALMDHAEISKGAKARKLLDRSLEIFETVGQIAERETDPVLWGALRMSASKALREIAQHRSPEEAIRLYHKCYDLAETAMEVVDEKHGPDQQAYIRNFLGTVVTEMGLRSQDANEARALYRKAIEFYEDGLRRCVGAAGMQRKEFEEKLEFMRESLRQLDESPDDGPFHMMSVRKPH